MECEICDVEYTSCPKQQNLGRVNATYTMYLGLHSQHYRILLALSNVRRRYHIYRTLYLILFLEYIAVDADFVHPLPDNLPSEIAAPLLCGKIDGS